MDKIYKLLPWLNSLQAVDWLSRLTETEMTETLLISLCDAGHSNVFLDVGGACSGLDDDDWITEVIASGKQMVLEPALLLKDLSERPYVVLRGDVIALTDGKSGLSKNVKWFPNSLSSCVACFKQADILALADKINANEAAEKVELVAQLERHRVQSEKDRNALSDAQEEIIRLQDKLEIALGRQTDNEPSPTWKKTHLLAIGGLLRLIRDNNRPRYNQAGMVTAISSMNWTGASESSLNHIFAEANATAKDADSELAAKLEAIELAVKQSTSA